MEIELGTIVVVTTDKDKRGVFCGRLESVDRENRSCVLTDVRNAVYWSASVKGFLGLAATGPDNMCRISPAAPRMEVLDYTAIIECSKAAIASWETEPWKD